MAMVHTRIEQAHIGCIRFWRLNSRSEIIYPLLTFNGIHLRKDIGRRFCEPQFGYCSQKIVGPSQITPLAVHQDNQAIDKLNCVLTDRQIKLASSILEAVEMADRIGFAQPNLPCDVIVHAREWQRRIGPKGFERSDANLRNVGDQIFIGAFLSGTFITRRVGILVSLDTVQEELKLLVWNENRSKRAAIRRRLDVQQLDAAPSHIQTFKLHFEVRFAFELDRDARAGIYALSLLSCDSIYECLLGLLDLTLEARGMPRAISR